MDLHQLEIFIVAAQYESFTEASKTLHMVPSAISHSIARLEEQLGVPLFTRSQNKLTLTVYGERFLADAYRLTSMGRRAISNVQHLLDQKEGALHIGFIFPSFIERYLDEAAAFCEKYPLISVTYRQYDSFKISTLLESKEIDIAFGREATFSSTGNCSWHKLFRNPFVLILRTDHPLAKYESVTLAQLEKETIILMDRASNPGMYDIVTHLFMNEDIVPTISSRTNNHRMTILEVAIGMGVTITTQQIICNMNLPGNVTYRNIASPLAFHDIGIAWNKGNTNPLIPYYLAEFGIEV